MLHFFLSAAILFYFAARSLKTSNDNSIYGSILPDAYQSNSNIEVYNTDIKKIRKVANEHEIDNNFESKLMSSKSDSTKLNFRNRHRGRRQLNLARYFYDPKTVVEKENMDWEGQKQQGEDSKSGLETSKQQPPNYPHVEAGVGTTSLGDTKDSSSTRNFNEKNMQQQQSTISTENEQGTLPQSLYNNNPSHTRQQNDTLQQPHNNQMTAHIPENQQSYQASVEGIVSDSQKQKKGPTNHWEKDQKSLKPAIESALHHQHTEQQEAAIQWPLQEYKPSNMNEQQQIQQPVGGLVGGSQEHKQGIQKIQEPSLNEISETQKWAEPPPKGLGISHAASFGSTSEASSQKIEDHDQQEEAPQYVGNSKLQTHGVSSSSAERSEDSILEEERLQMPPSFQNIADFPSEYQTGDIPIFWHIPKAAGSTIKDMLAGCFQIRTATEVGIQFGHSQDETLQVFEKHGAQFVNQDTTSLDGIAKAKRLNLVNSGMVDAIVTHYVFEASELFSPGHRGKFFTVIRDPIDRYVSLMHYLGKATEEKTYEPAFANMTIEDFAHHIRMKNDWMTRWLSNARSGEVTKQHLNLAKEVLRTKFVVGVFPNLEKSIEHFEKYFGWQLVNRPHRKKCVEELISVGANMHTTPNEEITTDSRGYYALREKNQLDMELYSYAQQLFQEQSEYFKNIPRPEVGTLAL